MKTLLGAILLAFSLSVQAEQLLDDYNEKPVHAIDLSSSTTSVNIQLYVTENKNNPSSTFILHNNNVNQSCIFWAAEDYLRTLETESLPAKVPTPQEDA